MKGELKQIFSTYFEEIDHKDTKNAIAHIPWEIYIALVESELKLSTVLREGLFCLLAEGHLVLEGINDHQEEREEAPQSSPQYANKDNKTWERTNL